MDPGSIIGVILLLILIVGISIYFIQDFKKYRETVDKEFDETTKKLAAEKSDRLSNLRFVVDQVNTVNGDMFSEFSSNISRVDGDILRVSTSNQTLWGTHDTTMNNLSKYFSIVERGNVGVGTTTTTTPVVRFDKLPTYTNPDLHLLSRVSMTMGLTANDLSGPAGKVVKFCDTGSGNDKKCIEFPDANGNTVLTGFGSTGEIKMNSAMTVSGVSQFNNDMNLKGKMTINGMLNVKDLSGATVLDVSPLNVQANKPVIVNNATSATSGVTIGTDGSITAKSLKIGEHSITTDGTNLVISTPKDLLLNVNGNVKQISTAGTDDYTDLIKRLQSMVTSTTTTPTTTATTTTTTV